MKAITVRQPWAWLLIHGGKDIENREWRSSYRGPIAIHAARGLTREEWRDCFDYVASFDPDLARRIPAFASLMRGAVLGTMTMTGCVTDSNSPWFQGTYGFVLKDARPFKYPIFVRGALNLWEVDLPQDRIVFDPPQNRTAEECSCE